MSEASEEQQIDNLLIDSVADLKAAAGNERALLGAIKRYCKRGEAIQLSPMELWDYFAISSPSLPEQAGYSGNMLENMEQMFSNVTKDLWG